MTPDEYRKALEKLSPEEFKAFNEDFGGGQKTIEERVTEFVENPQYERRICQLLGLKTEEEKLIEASIESANANKSISKKNVISIIIAIASLVVTIIIALCFKSN